MKIFRVVVAFSAAVAATMASVPARATHTFVPPIDRSRLPELAGDTTILGDETAWMRVRLPESVDTDKMWMDDDLQVRGHGRIFGLLMVREVDGEIKRRAPSMDFLRSGMCNRPGCDPRPFAMMSGGGTTRDGKLPAGIYRLYLLADGGPVKVRFSLPELPGAVRLNPTRPAQAKVHSLTPRVHTDPAGIVFSAGDRRPFKGRGYAFQVQWVDPMGAGLIDRGFCYYKDEAPADQTTAYMPPECPVYLNVWWELFMLRYRTYTPPYTDDYWEMHLGAPHLPKAMGSWYTLTSPAEHYGAAALWLRVD